MCPPRLAYRIEREGGGGGLQLLQDCDDDGEDAAGGRMLHLLQVGGLDAWCVSSMVWLVLIDRLIERILFIMECWKM